MRHVREIVLIVVLWSIFAEAPAGDRIALVVGNASYEKASVLDNTTNDAADMAAALRGLGFEVLLRQDIRTRGEFREAVREFREALARGRDSTGLFFYAGHAVQVNGENYLIPTAADLRDIPDLEIETLSLGYVTAMAGDAGNPVNFFLIDACRDNPFRGFSRSLNRGLAVTDTPEGSVIVYAASPGRVASDGSGRNSPFTANLLREIGSPEHVLLMLQNVVKGVRQDTAGQQLPWFHTSLTGDFYFNPPAVENTHVTEPAATPATATASPSTEPPDPVANRDSSPVPATAPEPVLGTAIRDPVPAAEPVSGATLLASVDPQAGASASGRWKGRLHGGQGPGASVTLDISSAQGGYVVSVSQLISYGEVPPSCTFASGRITPRGAGELRMELTHDGCRGAGDLRLQGGRLTGNIHLEGKEIRLDLSRR